MHIVDLNGQLVKKFDATETKDANIRNSLANEPQIVQARSPLLIDGLLPQGTFNHLHENIWDSGESKISPSKQGEIYLARVSMAVTSDAPTVITVDLDLTYSPA